MELLSFVQAAQNGTNQGTRNRALNEQELLRAHSLK